MQRQEQYGFLRYFTPYQLEEKVSTESINIALILSFAKRYCCNQSTKNKAYIVNRFMTSSLNSLLLTYWNWRSGETGDKREEAEKRIDIVFYEYGLYLGLLPVSSSRE